MHRRFVPATTLLAALALAGCQSAPIDIQPPASLSQVTPLAVTGRQGWLPGRELRFGSFTTLDLRQRTQTHTRDCPQGCSSTDLGLYQRRFQEVFRSTTQRASFTLADGAGGEADVLLAQRFDEESRRWVTRWFGLPTDAGGDVTRHISLVGTVQPAAPDQPGWRLVMSNTGNGAMQGWAEDETGQRLTLAPLRTLRGPQGPATLPAALTRQAGGFGYSLEREGRAWAAVGTLGAGTVWIDPGLSAHERLAAAALASVLLLATTAPR